MLQEKLITFALGGEDWVLWILISLSVLCIGIAIERAIFGALNTTPQVPLQRTLTELFRGGEPGAALAALDALKGVEARVLGAGLRGGMDGGPASAEEVLTGTLALERMRLDRGLIVLGTTGSNAPFIGLFGTVLGIMKAFHELAQNEAEAAASVMTGISEALVATAVGLLVAIPAVVLYNVFQRRNKDTLTRLESLSHHLLARLKAQPPESDQRARQAEGA